jgi:hypothetical protein
MSVQPYIWTGAHNFEINGSGMHEDTLRISQNVQHTENMFRLLLPTLCITYADMVFQNAVGGQQMNYPGSAVYGPVYFDPPVELTGDNIEKYTYIRGAHRVEIGPQMTLIEFPSWKELVIPRLRIDESPGTPAHLSVDRFAIFPETPLKVTIKQYADGRHVGGITVEVRHPKYSEPQSKPVYDLWVRIIDARMQHPLKEAIFEIWRWDRSIDTPFGFGDFVLDSQHVTNSNGVVQVNNLLSGELHWYTIHLPGWRITPHCLRPLPQQSVRMHMNAWKMLGDTFRYTWQKNDDLNAIARLTHFDTQDILNMNNLSSASNLGSGMQITLPCYEARYCPENWETLDEIAQRFKMPDTKTLADANGLGNIKEYNGAVDLILPQWRFFHARPGDSLAIFDKQFSLPEGSTVPANRVYRPRDGALIPGEVVAVPTKKLQR